MNGPIIRRLRNGSTRCTDPFPTLAVRGSIIISMADTDTR
jgi:hypothetical protein